MDHEQLSMVANKFQWVFSPFLLNVCGKEVKFCRRGRIIMPLCLGLTLMATSSKPIHRNPCDFPRGFKAYGRRADRDDAGGSTMEEFRRYWSQKRDSDHSQRPNLDVFKIAAGEVRAYFDPDRYKRILEIGCGAGEVFEYLKFDPNHYLGVDFSPSILSAFAKRHPKVRLMEGEASSFLIPEKFDFILINGVIQYCLPEATRKCIANLKQMLSEEGAILIGNVPNRLLRYKYYCGLFLDKSPATGQIVINLCKTAASSVLKRHLGIGYWYTTDQIRKIAAKQDLDTWFFGSLLYPYRFSALMRHRGTTPRSTRSKSED